MSNRALTWAFDQEIPATAKFVLVALADFADESASCYPSQQTLAKMTGLGVRTVRRAIADLEDARLVVTERRNRPDGTRTSDRFFLVMGTKPAANVASGAPAANYDRTSGQLRQDKRPTTTGQAATLAGQEPSVEPLEEPSVEPSSSEVAVATPRPDVDELLDALDEGIVRNGGRRPARSSKNVNAARLLLDRDGVPLADAVRVARWCQADEFWRSNVLSMSKFREKFDTLRLQSQRPSRSSAHVRTNARYEANLDVVRQMEALEAAELRGLGS